MAGKDRIGALYYEVILDPRGFAKGVTSVKADADLLVRAVQGTTSELARIDAELDAVIKRSLNASGEERDILRSYALQLMQDKRDLIKSEQDAEEAAAAEAVAREERENKKKEDELARHHKWRRQVIENSRKLEERQLRENKKSIEAARKKRQSERDYFAFYQRAASRKYRMDLQGRNAFAGHARAITNLTRDGLGGMRKMASGASGGLSKLSGNFAQMLGMNPKMQGFARVFGALGPHALLIGTALTTVISVFSKAIGMADQWAKKQMRLTAVMSGRSALSKQLEMDMRDLASSTAFSRDELMEFAISLKTMGVATKDVRGIAETVGALSGGDNQKMKFIQKAYTDVLTKGRLMGQEALQLANQGVPIYKALAGSMGISAAEAQKLAENGKISADQFQRAMVYQANAVGGVAAMENGMWTISGQWEQIKEAIGDAFLAIGEDLQPAMVGLMWVIARLVEGLAIGFKFLWNAVVEPIKFILKLLTFDVAGALDMINGKERALSESLDEQREIAMQRYEEEERLHRQQLETAEDLIKKEQERLLTQEERARREHQAQLNKLIMEKKITKEQALQIVRERGRVNAELRRREEEEAAAEAEFEKREADWAAWNEQQLADEAKLKELKEQALENEEKLRDDAIKLAEKQHGEEMKRIDEALAKKIGDRDSADSSSGASFEAGSAEEFEFLRQMEMQARRDAMQEQWEDQAAADRATANAHLTAMVSNTNAMANAAKRDIENKDSLSDFGYP